MIRLTLVSFSILLLVSCTTSAQAADTDTLSFQEHLEQANRFIRAYRHFEASDELKKATILGGAKHPSLHMRLGILYYGLGLIPEAIEEGEKAVALAPSSKWYKYDLAKFFYVDKQYDKAEEQLVRLLKFDPGFTLGYYYLAELFFRKQQYDLAWLSLTRAKLLGHKGQRLAEKLRHLSSRPEEQYSLAEKNDQLYRFIKLSSASQAEQVLNEIRNGKLFENLELELKKDQDDAADFGVMPLGELQDSLARSLAESTPFAPPVIVKTGDDYRIMQRIAPFAMGDWQKIIAQKKAPAPALVIGKTELQPTPAPATPATSGAAPVRAAKQPELPAAAAREPSPHSAEHTLTRAEFQDRQRYADQLAAFYTLENWRQKWAAQDVQGYLHSYSQNFHPPYGMSLTAWQQSQQKSISRPTSIEVKVEDTVIEFLGEDQLLVTFKQTYNANTYHDVALKALTLVKETDGWKIVEEREIKKLAE